MLCSSTQYYHVNHFPALFGRHDDRTTKKGSEVFLIYMANLTFHHIDILHTIQIQRL